MALLGMLVDAPARFHAAHPLDVTPQHEGDLLVVQLRFDVAVGGVLFARACRLASALIKCSKKSSHQSGMSLLLIPRSGSGQLNL